MLQQMEELKVDEKAATDESASIAEIRKNVSLQDETL